MGILQKKQAIGISWISTAQEADAVKLAEKLGLPITEAKEAYPLLLMVTESRLELRQTGPKPPGPLFVDFTQGAVNYRRKFGGGRKQPIAKAVGLKGNKSPSVLDVTAGLGRDAFVLACLGCRVHLIERSPIIGALLADGLARAANDPEIGPMVRDRMQLTVGNSIALLTNWQNPQPEVIYLDPMYPHRTKSALVKKEMRILRELVGDDEDAPALLLTALGLAGKRVVVKRPRLAPAIDGPTPSFAITSKNSRFDVYVIA